MNILIAEDDPVSALSLRALLEELGYSVNLATHGVEAWLQWQITANQIVILDWMMPGMSGVEVCRRIRAGHPGSYIGIIMLTARNERKDCDVALEAGVDVFLSKPLKRDELIAGIQVAERILSMEQRAKMDLTATRRAA